MFFSINERRFRNRLPVYPYRIKDTTESQFLECF